MLTLQRVGEIAAIHAREIDRDAKLWTIPSERTKNHRTHVVPLTDAALYVLRSAFGWHVKRLTLVVEGVMEARNVIGGIEDRPLEERILPSAA